MPSLTFSQLCQRLAFDDVQAASDAVAIHFRIGPERQHRDVTYAELAEAVRARAGMLTAEGCKPGDRIALLMPHSERLVTSFLGAIYAGLIPSIVAWPTAKMDADKYRRNVLAVVENLRATWIATDTAMLQTLGPAIGGAGVIDPRAPDGLAPAAARVRSEGTAFIQFSGGTTGTQKSVPISLQMLHRQLDSYQRALELADTDRIVSWLPLYHDMGLVACLLMPMVFRIPVVMFSPIEWVMDPHPFLRALGTLRPTLCWLPNFAYSFLATRAAPATLERERDVLDLSSLRAVINCSEPVRSANMDGFLERFQSAGLRSDVLATCYALAEATFAVTQSSAGSAPLRLRVSRDALARGQIEPNAAGDRELVSCGAPIEGVQVQIATTTGAPCPAGEIGEIRLRGDFVMDGYLDAPDPAAMGPAFSDGWFCTGDLGAFVGDQLYVTGRKKDLIIIGGSNVFPEDIEAAVSEIPGVHAGRSVALGIYDEALGTERLVVVAELAQDADPASSDALESEIRKATLRVAGVAPHRAFVVPPRWIVKSTAGKISRTETRDRVLARWDELSTPRPRGSESEEPR